MRPVEGQREHWFDWSERAQTSLEAGLQPGSPEGRALAEEIVRFSGDVSPRDLAAQIEFGSDARAERYWQLLAIMNGCPPIPARQAAVAWIVAALRA